MCTCGIRRSTYRGLQLVDPILVQVAELPRPHLIFAARDSISIRVEEFDSQLSFIPKILQNVDDWGIQPLRSCLDFLILSPQERPAQSVHLLCFEFWVQF